MSRKHSWFAINGLALIILLLATFGGYEGAENMIVFWVASTFMISFLYLSDDFLLKIKADGAPSVTKYVAYTYDFLCLSIIVWFGWFWVGAMYLTSMILQYRLYSDDEKNENDYEFTQDNPDIK